MHNVCVQLRALPCFLTDVLSTSMMKLIYENDAAPSSSSEKQCTNSHMQT